MCSPQIRALERMQMCAAPGTHRALHDLPYSLRSRHSSFTSLLPRIAAASPRNADLCLISYLQGARPKKHPQGALAPHWCSCVNCRVYDDLSCRRCRCFVVWIVSVVVAQRPPIGAMTACCVQGSRGIRTNGHLLAAGGRRVVARKIRPRRGQSRLPHSSSTARSRWLLTATLAS